VFVALSALRDAAPPRSTTQGPSGLEWNLALPHLVTAVGRDSVRAHSCPRLRTTKGQLREGRQVFVAPSALRDAAPPRSTTQGPSGLEWNLALPRITPQKIDARLNGPLAPLSPKPHSNIPL
jgi:hypothetical protein